MKNLLTLRNFHLIDRKLFITLHLNREKSFGFCERLNVYRIL